MPDLPDHDNAQKWLKTFGSLSPGKKSFVAFCIAVFFTGWIMVIVQQLKIANLKEEIGPLRTAALVSYGKDDRETLKKFVDAAVQLRRDYTNALGVIDDLKGEVEDLKQKTERAAPRAKAEKLVEQFKELPKARIVIKRYDAADESVRFSKHLESLFSRSGFEVIVFPAELNSLNLMSRVGQEIWVNSTNYPTCADAVFTALNNTGMNLKPIRDASVDNRNIEFCIFRISK